MKSNKVFIILSSIFLGLAVLAALPILFGIVTKLGGNITLGGTGILIVIGVCLETYKQIESQLVSHTYKKGRRRSRWKVLFL